MTHSQILALMPIMVLSGAAVVLMLQASVRRSQTIAWVISGFGLLAALWGAGFARAHTQKVTPLLRVDDWGLFFSALLIVAALITLILSRESFSRLGERKEEYYLLLVLSVLGGVVLVQATHVASLLLGMELMGIALYAMIAFPEKGPLPLEAAIKYLVLSACASAMLLFGFALLYAATGDLSFTGLGARAARAYAENPTLMLAGSGLVLAGLGFKLSVVPFHMWTPDVYEGAPTPVTGFLATVSKGAIFIVFTRLFTEGNLHNYATMLTALAALAIASMLVGNWLALQQDNIKRLLAYSSIAHFGYLFIVLICAERAGPFARDAITFYLTAYIVTTLAAFSVVTAVAGDDERKYRVDAFQGLFWRKPLQAAVLTVALLSLAGIPLTAGFVGKFFVISVGIDSARWFLLGALLLGSAIAIYYYLRIVFAMSKEPAPIDELVEEQPAAHSILVLFLLAMVLYLGAWPQPFIRFIAGI